MSFHLSDIEEDGPTEDIGPSSFDPYSEYKSEGRRLETFYDWPSDSVVSKEDLAQNGFIYLHSQDRTQCIFCRAVIRDWEPGDNVSQEHRKFSSECPFVAGYSVGNQPLLSRPRLVEPVVHIASCGTVNIFGGKVTLTNHGMLVSGGSLVTSQGLTGTIPSEQSNTADAKRYTVTPAVSTECQSSNNRIISQPKYTNWESRIDRLRSFATWPHNTRPTPAQLVDAGLLYMGTGSEDRCKCFWCGGELYDWEPNDDPMEEHAKWFPDCGYVLQVKGRGYVQNVKNKQLGIFAKEEIPSVINKYDPIEAQGIQSCEKTSRMGAQETILSLSRQQERKIKHQFKKNSFRRISKESDEDELVGSREKTAIICQESRPPDRNYFNAIMRQNGVQRIWSCEKTSRMGAQNCNCSKRSADTYLQANDDEQSFRRISKESDEDELAGSIENNSVICQESEPPARNYFNAIMRQNGVCFYDCSE